MTSGIVGAPETRYAVYIDDPLGNRLDDVSNYASIDGAVGIGSVGVLTLILPDDYTPAFLADDNIVEIWRSPIAGFPSLLMDRLWWMRDFDLKGTGREQYNQVTCFDQNFILADPGGKSGRIVAYDADEPYTDKVDEIDNMMKAYMRENVGSLALDADRDLSVYLSIAADDSLGPIGHSSGTSRRLLLPVLNELSAMAARLGTYVAWDIVCTQPPDSTIADPKFSLEFRTYINYRGDDHRQTSGDPVWIGPDHGNLEDWDLVRQTSGESNYIYARGEGIGSADAIAPASDTDRIGISPFNRREFLVDSQAEDALSLADDAETGLREGRFREYLTGTLRDTDAFRFGFEYGYGDYLTAQVRQRSFDCRLDALRFQFSRQGETLTPVLRFDDV